MKIIYNRILPVKGFAAINLFGLLFARKGAMITERTINHEKIHTAQMKELLYVPFYILYLAEWLVKLLFCKDAYRSISFEREAYANDGDANYLRTRQPYAWAKNTAQP